MSSFSFYSSLTTSTRSSASAAFNCSPFPTNKVGLNDLNNRNLGNSKHNNLNDRKDEEHLLIVEENFSCHKRIVNKRNFRIKR